MNQPLEKSMTANQITWRPATSDDIGLLARFRMAGNGTWFYGLLLHTEASASGLLSFFRLKDTKCHQEKYPFCEVQVVSPKMRGLEWIDDHDRRSYAKTMFGDVRIIGYPISGWHIYILDDDAIKVDSLDHGKQLAWELWQKRVMEEVIEL